MKAINNITCENYNSLFDAFLKDNRKKFSKLIYDGANVNCVSDLNKSLISMILHDRSKKNKAKYFLDILLKNNVSLKQIGTELPLLTILITSKNTKCLKKLLDNNINANYSCSFKVLPHGPSHICNPPIFHAIDMMDDEAINLLLKYNIDFEIEDPWGETLINHLIFKYCIEKQYKRLSVILEKILQLGADPNKIGVEGSQAIHYLASWGERKYLFDILFKNSNNIDINAKDMFGDTPLTLAAFYNNFPCVKFLVKKGADLNIAGDDDYTAITFAAVFDNFEIFNYLLDNGADLLVIDKEKNNILHQILNSKEYEKSKHYKYIKKISKLHPKLIKMKNAFGETPKDIVTNN